MKKFPVHRAFTLLEPGPVVLVTTAGDSRPNIMTLSWTMVLDFTPRFAFMTGMWNFSCRSLLSTRECVIAVPAVELAETTVRIGSCSGAGISKFEKFGLTPLEASTVKAPLIAECYANIECRVVDHIERHNIFVLDAVEVWIDEKRKSPRFFHAVGDGRFIVDGKKINHREIMIEKLPAGV
ncbi:MAG: flavin reductase family protein [Bacteroidales bacterium]|jgi:flavin reductase (DIM6/NTAB) family NADH-FMN oxidoreductase RutF|nr:flavin reductase family protein [Bacteroidales bacterium]